MGKKEYDINYRKKAMSEKKKAQFNTDLDYKDKQELDLLLKEKGLSKAEFIRISKRILEEDYIKFKKGEDRQ